MNNIEFKSINDFEFCDKDIIGKGANSIVYKAIHKKDRKEYALKKVD